MAAVHSSGVSDGDDDVRGAPGPIAWRWLAALSVTFAAVLVVTSNRYGYHRDELYFIAIGGHPAFGYIDQPPLVPLLAHALNAISGHSLIWLRVPSAVAGSLVVLITGLIAREFGGGRGAQLLEAASTAGSGFVLGTSHLMSTATFDLLAWTVIIWLVVRAIRDDGPVWLLVGVAAALSLEIKTLPIFLLSALVVSVVVAGPRRVFTSRWLWCGGLIALAGWTPNLIWQATHHWPQLTLARSVAAGHSGSSQPRALFVPYQVLLMGPPLAPVWIAGLWRLARDPALVRWRSLLLAYLTLVAVFIVTGGKPYYLAGMYPALFAAGAAPAMAWARTTARRATLATALAVSAAISAVVALPVVPARVLHDTPIVAMNYDAGEQVGWPDFARTITNVYDRLSASDRAQAIVLTGNYGEAGAILRFAPHLRPVESGHNALWDYGPPPAAAHIAIAIGYTESDLRGWFRTVQRVDVINNGDHLDNDEQGNPVWLCRDPTRPWTDLWPAMRNLG